MGYKSKEFKFCIGIPLSISPGASVEHDCSWRASETLSRVTNGNHLYMVCARHFSNTGPVVHNVGGAKCQPFLKCSNYW